MDHTTGTKKRALIATIAIFFSRILGLVREQVFAFFFGAGAVLDAFYVAFRIPNLLRDLAAEGALSQSFVTIFSQKLITNEKDEARALANKTITFITLVMGIVVILGEIFAPQLVSLIGMGFSGEKFDLTVHLLRILFPYIFFITLAALLMGVLNANKKFFIPFSASTFCNLISIVMGLLFAYLLSPDYTAQTWNKILHDTTLVTNDYLALSSAITGMALGTLLGGFGQFVFQLPSAHQLGFFPKLDFRLNDPGLIKVLKLTGPAIIAGAAVQVNVLVNTIFASFLTDGSVAYLQFAFRLMQFPLGVFGVAIAAASGPVLAQMIVQKDHDKFRQTIRSSIQMSLFLTLPSLIGLIVLSQAIISLIYGHGRFDNHDTQQTAQALMAYALGISSYALIKIYQPAFLAFHNAKTPMKIALFSIGINAFLNVLFIFVLGWGHWAIALSTAIVAGINLILLGIKLTKNISGIWDRGVWMTTGKIVLASVVMGLVTLSSFWYLQTIFIHGSLLDKTALVLIPMLLAVVSYLGCSCYLGIKDARYLLDKILRRI
ncbi:MAG: membrane protein [uncultured bacterium]|nr:MAG: membrane protein [uncultured bacterium]